MRDIMSDLEAGRHAVEPDPAQRVRQTMQRQLPRRFYRRAEIAAAADGAFEVHLDGRAARTPGGAALSLPSEAIARMVVDEFAAQKDHIDPVSMPVWRIVNTAVDGVAQDTRSVIEDIMRYSSSDLVCYRAEAPEALVARQAQAWDGILDWARAALGARFFLAEGVIHVEQPREAIGAIGIHLSNRAQPLRLAALHVMTTLTGSALIALAIDAGELSPETGWAAAHVDEDWNVSLWGEDAEARTRRDRRWSEMQAAARLSAALRA